MTVALIVALVLAAELLIGIMVGRFIRAGQDQLPPVPQRRCSYEPAWIDDDVEERPATTTVTVDVKDGAL